MLLGLAWPAGPRRRARLARRPRADHHDVPGRPGPQPRLRRLRRHVRCRRGRRPHPRWLAHRPRRRRRPRQGWRLTFLINVPIGLIAAFLAPRFLRESESHPGELDVPGAITGTLGLLGLVYGFTRAGEEAHGWGDPWTIASPRRRRRAARRVRLHRVPRQAPAAAGPDLQQPHPRHELPGDDAGPGRDVRDVLLPEPVHPAGRSATARCTPASRSCRSRVGIVIGAGPVVQPGQPDRPALHRRRRHADGGGRAVRLLPALGADRHRRPARRWPQRRLPRRRRQLLGVDLPVHRADVGRHGPDLRAADPDRRAPRALRGLRHRLGRAQHDAAGRWRARSGDPEHRLAALRRRHRRTGPWPAIWRPANAASRPDGVPRAWPSIGSFTEGATDGLPGRRGPDRDRLGRDLDRSSTSSTTELATDGPETPVHVG